MVITVKKILFHQAKHLPLEICPLVYLPVEIWSSVYRCHHSEETGPQLTNHFLSVALGKVKKETDTKIRALSHRS